MKIRRAEIHNFKGIKDLEIDFTGYDGEPRFLTCLVGDNGSGKTTALQAIALCLSLATRKTPTADEFAWHGFMPERVAFQDSKVSLEMAFDPEEIKLTRDVFDKYSESSRASAAAWSSDYEIEQEFRIPSDLPTVQLEFERGWTRSQAGEEAVAQCRGRYYFRQLAEKTDRWGEVEPVPGDVFWFDQFRIMGTGLLSASHPSGQGRIMKLGMWGSQGEQAPPAPTWVEGSQSLREMLVGWWAIHTSPRRKGRDLLSELEPRVALLFPGTHFIGVEPKPGATNPTQKDFYFLLERGDRVYDIAEMSSGEQAVFEILYEFVRLRIARSVVLIDEIELHLHPSQQQALLHSLRDIGPDCQFIITTHSPYIENALPSEEIVRLPGGPNAG